MRGTSRRDLLLDAASAVVSARGGSALTLDAVAAEAGLSKGGVLYHFPTKEALISAMIGRELDQVDQAIQLAMDAERAGGGGRPGAFARAYVRVSFASLSQGGCPVGGLLAAVANDPSVLQGYRARTETWRDRMGADGVAPCWAEAIRLATDGLYYSRLIGAATPSPEALPALEAALLSLAEAPPTDSTQDPRSMSC